MKPDAQRSSLGFANQISKPSPRRTWTSFSARATAEQVDERARPVLVVCNDSDYFLRHRLHVVERLVDLGFDVTVATGGEPIEPEFAHGWTPLHVPVERFKFNVVRDVHLLSKSLLLAWKVRPVAVHLITLKPAVMSGMAMMLARPWTGRPKRILITIPGLGRLMSPRSTTHTRSGFARWLVARVVRILSRRPEVHFTFESSHDRNYWVRSGLADEANSSVVSGAGVDPRKFYPDQGAHPRKPTRILFASRLIKSKGLDAFIAAAHHFRAREDVRFFVAGMVEEADPDGYSRKELDADASLTFLGEVKNIPDLLRRMDVVCLPTRYGEGIPRILIEAAATGLASVASDTDGCREIVSDESSGLLIPADDRLPERLFHAIERYLSDPALMHAHGEEARRRFSSGAFDEETIVESFVRHLVCDGTVPRGSSLDEKTGWA